MSNRPTIEDLAAAAGVSTATVDRVLNNRSKVREVTAQRVLLAAEDIGYHAAGLLKQRVRESKPRKRLSILLQRSNDEFYVALGQAIETACSRATDFAFETTIRFMDEVSPEYITEQLERESHHADAMAVVALDHLLINQEVERITGQNIPVLTLLSPLSTSTCTRHIGVDNRKAGRTAAWAINRLAKPGDVGILLGSHSYLNQDIAEISFISYFREIQHDFNLLTPQVNLDDNQLAYQATKDLIAQAPNISAIYSAGGGVEGIIKAIREAQKAQSITLICNELMSSTRLALSDGCIDMIIATPVSKIAQAVVETFTQALSQKYITPQPALQLTVELHVAENL
ncbi:LacI family DNA-binding transcriptional regulator [Idiomarina sp.]|uniref:LacI family DNA-binding transcriptional regulator n=1 Tax=Idiomarina sp. TaxID=1874361 RepID=UPI003A926EF6